MVEIELNLTKHCIETEIKSCHNRVLSAYFKTKGKDKALEEQLILLESALENFDFSALRSTYRELAGENSSRIMLTDRGGEIPDIFIDGRCPDLSSCLKEG